MTKMTKTQLVDENARLRAQCDHLEQRIAQLKTERAVRSAPAKPVLAQDIVSTYVNAAGVVMNKVRIGYNLFAHRPAAH